MTMDKPYIYEFGPFKLVPSEKHLLRDGNPVQLTPKSFDLLVVLVENAGHLVEKAELMNRVWPDSFVEEANLSVKMSELRRALGETSNENQYVETVPRRGYRFVAAVQEVSEILVEGEAGVRLEENNDRSAIKRFWPAGLAARLTGAVLLFALNVGGLRDRLFVTPEPVSIRSLAVLPLENLSGDQSQDYFADGMTEALITGLAKIGELRVVSRASVMKYKGLRPDLSDVGHDLNVDGILTGSVIRSGDRVRITVQLIHAATDRNLWAQSYERGMRDVLSLQDEVARGVVGELRVGLAPSEQSLAGARNP